MNKIDKNLCDAILKTIRDLSLKTVTTYYYEEKASLRIVFRHRQIFYPAHWMKPDSSDWSAT